MEPPQNCYAYRLRGGVYDIGRGKKIGEKVLAGKVQFWDSLQQAGRAGTHSGPGQESKDRTWECLTRLMTSNLAKCTNC